MSRLVEALTSRSWTVPHPAHVHCPIGQRQPPMHPCALRAGLGGGKPAIGRVQMRAVPGGLVAEPAGELPQSGVRANSIR